MLDVSAMLIREHKLARLIADLNGRGIRVLGLFGADPSTTPSHLPPVLRPGQGAPKLDDEQQDMAKQQPGMASSSTSSLLIDSPVRSGQSIFHEGDITIVGSVSSGAEIVATGSIHVYGTLRGRVRAGADGNSGAQIFCQRLEAELVSIDGYYRTADGIECDLLKRSVRAWLQDGKLKIRALS